jgi:LPXTG-motif cell wall-anchored protein
VRINPTTASTVTYPPPSTHCDPPTNITTSSTGSTALASTGSDITGPLTLGGLLLGLGAAMLMLVRRRRRGQTD